MVTGITDPDRIEEMVQYYRHYNIKWHDQMIEPFPGVAEGCQSFRKRALPRPSSPASSRPPVSGVWTAWGFPPTLTEASSGPRNIRPTSPTRNPWPAAQPFGPCSGGMPVRGDSPYDLLSGRAAGCRATVKVGWSSFKQDFLTAKSTRITSLGKSRISFRLLMN